MLAQTFGCARYVYNWGLRLRQDAWYQRQERINYHATSNLLTALKKEPEHTWLNEVSSVPLQQSLRHLGTAFQNFWQGRAGYPGFKSKHNRQSAEFTRSGFQWDGENLVLAKTPGPLPIRWSRRFQGDPSTITVSRDPCGRHFVSFLVEEEVQPLPPAGSAIGIDLGLQDVCVTSNGFKSGSPQYFRRYEKKLARHQRSLAHKKKGSKNRQKARLKVARVHAKIGDCRNDFLHKLSTRLIRENQTMAVETLAVKNMVRNRSLSKSISDAGWGELVRQLRYKAQWYGRTVIAIDRWYPSSKRCFGCGWVKNDLTLANRTWVCLSCGVQHDRDLNAARNILAAGQAVLAFGEDVSPVSDIGSPR